MKILKRIFVFVLFAFVAVLAFGAIKVSAANAVVYDGDFVDDLTTFSYTQNKELTVKNVNWIASVAQYNGGVFYLGCNSNNAEKGILSNNTDATMQEIVTALGANYTTDEHAYVIYTATSYNDVSNVTFSWDGNNNIFDLFLLVYSSGAWNIASTVEDAPKGSSASGVISADFNPTKNIEKIALVAYPNGSTSKTLRLRGCSISTPAPEGLPQLAAPTVAVANKVASWNAVDGAVNYKIGLYNAANAQSATYEVETTETSYDFSKFTSAGTWFVKVQAVADNTTSVSSELSTNEVSFVNASEVTCTPTEFLSFVDPLGQTDYTVSGTLKSFYTNYNETSVNNYDEGYNNVSFYLTDGTSKIIVYRLSGEQGANLQVGDLLTVKGKLQAYNSVNQIPQNGSTYVSIKPLCGVGVQTADAGNGAQHVRLVGGLNVNYEDVTALSFTITDANDAQKTTTITVSNVFGTLTANGTAGVAEITAASQGFEFLFALTITNIPAGTTLNVTATFTTAEGTYTSAVKTVEVPAAQ